MLLIIGGFFLIGASNGFNQVMEKHTDALMDRTKNRPIPSGRIGIQICYIYLFSYDANRNNFIIPH